MNVHLFATSVRKLNIYFATELDFRFVIIITFLLFNCNLRQKWYATWCWQAHFVPESVSNSIKWRTLWCAIPLNSSQLILKRAQCTFFTHQTYTSAYVRLAMHPLLLFSIFSNDCRPHFVWIQVKTKEKMPSGDVDEMKTSCFVYFDCTWARHL